MALSPYFSDEDLETQLRLQFDVEEMFDMDFGTVFGQITDRDNYFFLRLRGREFKIDKVTGSVSEVTR